MGTTSSRPAIQVKQLRKTYIVHQRSAGVQAALKSLVRRDKRAITAVNDIDFTVEPGEVVGFLGPNGAGKTTTLKMLSGLLHPTAGEAFVHGFQPWQRQRPFLRHITLVMGQRNQLVWDIPAADTYELNRVIYRIPSDVFQETLDELVELLELSDLITKPVRNLSLGERMKCEIAGALLHRPSVLFLDEPTIGLDVRAQRRIREFIAEYNARHGATVLLTSHYMADVVALCRRVIVIHHGQLLYDGQLAGLVERFSPFKLITIKLEVADGTHDFTQYGEVLEAGRQQVRLQVANSETPAIASQLLSDLPVSDLTIEDPPIEAVIEEVFSADSGDQPEPAATPAAPDT